MRTVNFRSFTTNVRAMDLSVQALREVTFAPKRNGYDPTGVDDFIDDVVAGFEQMENKLREADERIAAAEAKAESASRPESGGAMSASDIGKIWERAAAGAEATMEEARQEASRILDEARQNAAIAEAAVEDAHAEADKIRQEAQERSRQEHEQAVQSARAEADNVIRLARNDAESTRNSAQQEAESTLASARNEAARLAEQAQGQLRDEVEQLERARDELRSQVEQLNEHISVELGRVRETLDGALGVINSTEVGSREIPKTPPVHIPEARYTQGPEAFGDTVGFNAAQSNIGQEFAHSEAGRGDEHANQPQGSQNSNDLFEDGHFDSSQFDDQPTQAHQIDLDENEGNQSQDTWHQENEWNSQDRGSQDDNQSSQDWANESATSGAMHSQPGQQHWADQQPDQQDARSQFAELRDADNEEPSAWEVMQRNDVREDESPSWQREDSVNAQQDADQRAPWEIEDDRLANQANSFQQDEPARGSDNARSDDEGDYDPFLAELRRAVHDEGPLGPRNHSDSDNSIDSLYASSDEDKDSDGDKGGFFRRRR